MDYGSHLYSLCTRSTHIIYSDSECFVPVIVGHCFLYFVFAIKMYLEKIF
jgi:hypothetical protein